MTDKVTYIVRVDGFEITRFEIEPEKANTQFKRDGIRKEIAKKYEVPTHYIRMKQLVRGKYKK